MIRHVLLAMALAAPAPALASKYTPHQQAELDSIRDTPAEEMRHMTGQDIDRRMQAARERDQAEQHARDAAYKATARDSEVIPWLMAQYTGAVDKLVKERQDHEVCAGKLMAAENQLEVSLAAESKPNPGNQYMWTTLAALAGAVLGWFIRALLFRKPGDKGAHVEQVAAEE